MERESSLSNFLEYSELFEIDVQTKGERELATVVDVDVDVDVDADEDVITVCL